MKRLIALSFSLVLCSAAAAAIVATDAAAQAPARNPVQLAQTNDAGRANARAFNRPTPAQRQAFRAEFCQEAYARAAGRFAYLEARLNLTAAQAPAFARWRDLRLAAARRRTADCASRPAAQGPVAQGRRVRGAAASPVERLSREETRLQHRLADIQAERPALEALYNSLNAGQRRTLAQERGARFAGRGGMGPRLAFGGGNRMFRRGPMRGPQGPGMQPPADAPPPPQ
jgi:hypothetical protein